MPRQKDETNDEMNEPAPWPPGEEPKAETETQTGDESPQPPPADDGDDRQDAVPHDPV